MHECPDCGQACDCDGEDTWFEAPDDCTHECEEENDEDYGVEDERPTLPITIALNHAMLGADEHTVCEACARDEHWDCCLATWCTCDDPADGDKDAGLYDLYFDGL